MIVILLPVGFTGSQHHISTLGPTGYYPQTPSPLQYVSIEDFFNRWSSFASTGEYLLNIQPVGDAPIGVYGLLELNMQTNLPVTNPYDPNEIELRVALRAPSGKEVNVGAFWYQDFDLNRRLLRGKPGWKVRFTPDEVGGWTAVAYAPALGLHSSPIRFMVIPSDNPGFIQVNPKNPRYLAYENGDFFFPIGVNMAWWSGCCNPLKEYGRWLDDFTTNGGNTIRVWMADWSFGIEWKDTGLGNYDNRQYEAWLLDQLFGLAAQHGVKIILVLINHGAFSLEANSEWKDNPYNARRGGPLSSPDQFVTDPEAQTYFRQRLNYIINRWGYSPQLLAWEWFNEVNLTPITDGALIPWLMEMTAYLHERDVNRHLTTNSFAMRAQSLIWMLPGLDIIQTHEYSSQSNDSEHDLAGRIVQDFNGLTETTPAKPILMGEFGYSANNYGDDIEITGIHLHNGIWSTTFSGFAGSGMYWWWDIYIAAHDLWQQFKGLANFLKGVDLSQYQPFSPLQISGPADEEEQSVGLGLKGADTLIWLRSDQYTTQASVAARSSQPGSDTYQLPLEQDMSITLNGMADGQYTVSWFDPQGAEWLSQQTVNARNHTLVFSIPAFRDDLAAKIIQRPEKKK